MAALAVVVVALAPPAASARQPANDRPPASRGRLLDVPFLPQREELCGGAAASMVLRYWGAQSFPDDFASLVEPRAEGIRTDALVTAITARGWQASPTRSTGDSDAAWIQQHIAEGRPVIALIAAGPSRFHYVVVVAHTSHRVVLHDPAVGPWRVWSPSEFDQAWAASGRWALLVTPKTSEPDGAEASVARADGAPPRFDAAPAAAAPDACRALVEAMVAEAQSGELAAAATGLDRATRVCPGSAAAWRELAGVRFRQSQWRAAADAATHAADLDPSEPSAWDLLATSQYLDGQTMAALRSWNRIARPIVAGIDAGGMRRTRPPVIVERLGLAPQATLTAGAFLRASRRLDDLPSARATTLRYQPLGDGRASLTATVVERTSAPWRPASLVTTAVHAAIHRELRTAIASPTGSGELWSAGWRWWSPRPRVTFAVTALPPGRPWLVAIDGLWERATYDVGATRVRQRRHRSAVHLEDWATGLVRWRAGAALDRWDAAAFASVDGGLEVRSPGERVAAIAQAAIWRPTTRGAGFPRAEVAVHARTAARPEPMAWRAAAGAAWVGDGAPLDLWEGAGLGLARAPLLRAHPLLTDGVVTGDVFGRTLVFASAEHERRLYTRGGVLLGAVVFLDAAHAARRARPGDAWHADAGAGLRLHLPGGMGALRLDWGRGLRDGRHAISAGWVQAFLSR